MIFIHIFRALIPWRSKKQLIVTLSTCEEVI